MSVLNTMLSDLERRGARSTLTLAPTEADRFAPPAALQDPPKPRVRRVPARPAVLVAAAVATAAAVWLWPSSALPPSRCALRRVTALPRGRPGCTRCSASGNTGYHGSVRGGRCAGRATTDYRGRADTADAPAHADTLLRAARFGGQARLRAARLGGKPGM